MIERPSFAGQHLTASTAHLERELAAGWTSINGIDVATELAWRDAQAGTDEAAFEAIRDLEIQAQGDRASTLLGATLDQRWDARQRLAASQKRLYDAIEALTPTQRRAYGAWRAAQLG